MAVSTFGSVTQKNSKYLRTPAGGSGIGEQRATNVSDNQTEPGSGTLLIAHPWLGDPNFQRSVILVCDHEHEEGSFGLVISRKLETKVGEIVSALESTDHDLYLGGPVQPNTLHYVHTHGDLVDSAIKVQDGLFWGGDFDLIQAMVLADELKPPHIRFFAGYAGWGPGQLAEEIEEGSWILTQAPPETLLETEPETLWRVLLRRMGGAYSILSNFPSDPQNN